MAAVETERTGGPEGPALSACGLLRDLAARTWSEIRDGDEAGIRIGEESITDRLLLDLDRHLPLPSKVIKWNRFQEANATGADWDWWFVDGNRRGVGLRIQAKRVEYFPETFESLGHQNRRGSQVALLQSSAAESGLHPLYCLYLASRAPREGETRCASYSSRVAPPGWAGRPAELYGCSLTAPVAVETALAMKEETLDFFWPHLLPWSCLLCCERIAEDILERIDSQARRLQYFVEDRLVDIPGSLVTENLPPEVWSVIEGGAAIDDLSPPDVGATMVTMVDKAGD